METYVDSVDLDEMFAILLWPKVCAGLLTNYDKEGFSPPQAAGVLTLAVRRVWLEPLSLALWTRWTLWAGLPWMSEEAVEGIDVDEPFTR